MGSEYALKIHEPILADALCHDCGYSWTVFLSGGISSADELRCPECRSVHGTLFLGGYTHASHCSEPVLGDVEEGCSNEGSGEGSAETDWDGPEDGETI